jgi:hypothetical protein
MSDYVRVSIPTDLPAKALDFSKQSIREIARTIDAGDLIALASVGVNEETLWVVVLNKNESNGSSDICIAYPEPSLAVGPDVIVEKDVAKNSFEFCIWPQVVATVWTDDLVGGERHGKISHEALQYVLELSLPGARPTSDLGPPKGIRFGVNGVTPTLSYLKFRGMTAEVLDRFASPWWSLLENTFMPAEFAIAAITASNEKASTYLDDSVNRFNILPNDIDEVITQLRTAGMSTLMRGGKFNSLIKSIHSGAGISSDLVLSNTEEENIRRASESLGTFRLLALRSENERTEVLKYGNNRVLVEVAG